MVKGARCPDLAPIRAERDRLGAEKAHLEEMVRTHDALLTAAAHDLKNSLTAIIMRADRSSCIGVGWKSGNDGRMGY